MSNSFRKTPIFGFCTAPSEKADKKIWHSRARAVERDKLLLSSKRDYEDYITSIELDVSNNWSMSKDGKHYWAKAQQKDMRK